MMKKSLLLKVVSIIFIISSVIGLGSSIAMIVMKDEFLASMQVMGSDAVMYEAMLAPAAMTVAVTASIVGMSAGILGVMRKNAKACFCTMGIYIILAIVSLVQTMAVGEVTISSIGSTFLFPALYLVGVCRAIRK